MRKLSLRRLLIGLCVSGALYAVMYYYHAARLAADSHRQLVHEEQLTEQAGISLSRASLMDVKLPAAQDAGPIYEQLHTIWKGRASDDDTRAITYLCQNHSPTPIELSNARQALKHQARALALVHQAASRPYCVLQIHWETPNPSEILYPQLATVRNSARFLAAESILMAADGRYADAVKNAALGFKIGSQGAAGKSSIAYLVGVACDAITLGAMRKILYLYGEKPGVAALVHNEVAQNFKPPSVAAGLRTEAVMNIALAEYLRAKGWRGLYELSEEEPSLWERIYIPILGSSVWEFQLNASGIVILQQMRQAIPIADRPFYQCRSILAGLNVVVEKKSKLFGFAKIVLPQFESLAGKRAQVQNDAQMVMLAAALIDKHNHRSEYPSSTPAALDMFNGKPLHYRREGKGFVIYTPGLDNAFDGGSPAKRPKTSGYVFHYPMPSYYLHPEPKDP